MTTNTLQGTLRKMHNEHLTPVSYQLPVGDELLPLNELLGKKLTLNFLDEIFCIACGRKTKKSFNQGYCYPCLRKLAQCDTCIIKPEKCHYAQGTCREPEWGETHCMVNHIVYLANSSGLKVGITRETQVPTRWMDQGAIQALPLFRVKTRYHSGLVEVAIAENIADKTNWRAMLKGEVELLDMIAERAKVLEMCAPALQQLGVTLEDENLEPLAEQPLSFEYPVIEYPTKVSSFNFDKTAEVGGTLMGIKGQYLIFDGGVINIRKFAGYNVTVSY